MLVAENISCIRGEKKLFSSLSFSAAPQEVLFIKGPNGSGKSSLLRILAGLLKAESGSITWQGKSITDNDEYAVSLLYIGHNNAIKPELTVIENLRFWAELRGEPILIPAALSYFEMEGVADMPCHMLSAGWQRRVALANLITSPRRVWLLDEPTAHLDTHAANLLDGLIATRIKQGGTVLLSTHSDALPKEAKTLDVSHYA